MFERRKKKSVKKVYSNDLIEQYEKRAIIERKIFMVETLLKFIPASILTVFISIFYVWELNVTIFSFPISFYIYLILVGLISLVIGLYWFSSQLYEEKYPIIREINTLEEDRRIRVLRELEIAREEEKEKNRISTLNQEGKIRIKEKESELIPMLEKIRVGLKSDKLIKQETASIQFRRLGMDSELQQSTNDIIINNVRDCISCISSKMEEKALNEMFQGVFYLVMNSQKCTFFDMVKKDFYDMIKSFVDNEQNTNITYRLKAHHIFCNIADLKDLKIIIKPFKFIQHGKGNYKQYVIHTAVSLFNYNHNENLLEQTEESLMDDEYNEILNYLKEHLISYHGKSILLDDNIPNCKKSS